MKTLIYKQGNLLTAKDVQVIGHQSNCQNTFGSGIARSIREMYPEAYYADTYAAGKGTNTLGNFSRCNLPFHNKSSIRIIYNLYGQNLGTDYNKMYDRKTNYEALYCALEKMRNDFIGDSVGFPYKMGSALGGGSWDIVSRLIEVAFDGYEGDVIIYKFDPK